MQNLLYILGSILLTIVCWGSYGPTLHNGQGDMGGSRMRAFLCVGLAYFVIAVVIPILVLYFWGEKGQFTFSGVVWSSLAGAAGAVGALGIVLAFNLGGKPWYVMPLIFGCAPVVTATIELYFRGKYKDLPTLSLAGFLAGLFMVATGAFLVLFFAAQANKVPHGSVSKGKSAANSSVR